MRRFLFLFCGIALAWAGNTLGQATTRATTRAAPDPKLAALLARGEGLRLRLIDSSKRRLATSRADDERRELRERIAVLESKRGSFVPPMDYRWVGGSREIALAVGNLGHLELWQIEIVQVVDDRNMLVRVGVAIPHTVWLEGVATAGLVDGQQYKPGDGPFEVVGTKRYETALGSNSTVFLLRPLPIK